MRRNKKARYSDVAISLLCRQLAAQRLTTAYSYEITAGCCNAFHYPECKLTRLDCFLSAASYVSYLLSPLLPFSPHHQR